MIWEIRSPSAKLASRVFIVLTTMSCSARRRARSSEFAARSINLTRLESRPTRKGLGDYCFLIDCEGHISDEVVGDALRNIHMKQGNVKFLGSYPSA